tara:strand:- start:7615 stop:7773 length:159 start_codon:yes stop_codon:yes gene_type:complete
MTDKKKYYVIVSSDKKYTHGAFEYSPEGLQKAKDYIKVISIRSDEKFKIIEK